MTRTRRGLLALALGAATGCLGRDGSAPASGPNDTNTSRDDSGAGQEPLPDGGDTIVGIHGEFVEDESAVFSGYEIFSSDDEPFDTSEPFQQLFAEAETVPAEHRDSRISGATARSGTEEANAIAEVFRATSDGVPRSVTSDERFAHRYVRHEDELIRIEYYSFVEE